MWQGEHNQRNHMYPYIRQSCHIILCAINRNASQPRKLIFRGGALGPDNWCSDVRLKPSKFLWTHNSLRTTYRRKRGVSNLLCITTQVCKQWNISSTVLLQFCSLAHTRNNASPIYGRGPGQGRRASPWLRDLPQATGCLHCDRRAQTSLDGSQEQIREAAAFQGCHDNGRNLWDRGHGGIQSRATRRTDYPPHAAISLRLFHCPIY